MDNLHIMPGNHSTVKGFYYEQESLGVVPKIRLTVAGVEVEPLNKLTLTQSMNSITALRYPGRRKLKFETLTKHNLGDAVELRIYHEGGGWDKVSYYTWQNTPSSNIHNLRITRTEYIPASINTAEVYKYECDADFRGLGDTISVAVDNKMRKHISPKINLISSYEGEDHIIRTAGEYKVSKIFSDLAEYEIFKTGKYHILRLDGKKAILQQSDNVVIDHVTNLTTKGSINQVEDGKDVRQLVYWKGTEITKVNKGITGTLIGIQDGKEVKYTGVNAPVKQDKYFNINMGEYLEVFNMFVPPNEIQSFLKWKIKEVDEKKSFQMSTFFISTPLGGRANVIVIPNTAPVGQPNNGIGWTGTIVGKNISFGLGDKYSFDYTIDVAKSGDWSPVIFNWGDDWDTGAVWNS